MLIAHNITASRKTGEEITVVVPITSSEPGVVTASAAGCTFPDGDTVTIPGTRVWALNNSRRTDGWNAPAAASAIMKGRHGQTVGFEIDLGDILPYSSSGTAYTESCALIRNYQVSDGAISWQFYIWSYVGNYTVHVIRNTQSASLFSFASSGYTKNILRVTVVFPAELSTAIAYRYSIDGGSVVAGSVSPAAIPGEHAGTCQTVFHGVLRTFYAPSALSTTQQDMFHSGGFPTNACTVQYSGNEEGSSLVYDQSGNNYDGVYGLDNTHLVSQVVRTYTDSVPVVPASSIRVTIPAGVASPVTLSLSRPRAGVPSRASAGEKYETTTGTITLNDITTEVAVGPAQHVRSRLP